MCVVGAVGYFVVKKKSAAGIAAAVGMRDDVSATAKPMDPTPEVNASVSTLLFCFSHYFHFSFPA
ncbi:unnamed protein product [Brugia pahangi]|uniref:Secreted protein n=1 Tax=Brugia pahangi TaxID=6280 RepID=A0A0N4TRC7_BRUPA|nr:unnamed protein product [Brugia pahangi]